jgi:TonB family protein
LQPWLEAITQKALAAWKISGTGKMEVLLGIGKDGKLAHLVIVNSSNNAKFDNSVLNACVSAEPYPPAPNSTKDTTEVNILFEH